jgi:hypothetical protein
MIGIIQLLLAVIFAGQFNSLEVDLLTPKEFLIREIVILLVIVVLQIIKLAVSTRNTHSR